MVNIELSKEELTAVIDGMVYAQGGYANVPANKAIRDANWELIDRLKATSNLKEQPRTLEAIIDRKCAIRRELADLDREQNKLTGPMVNDIFTGGN